MVSVNSSRVVCILLLLCLTAETVRADCSTPTHFIGKSDNGKYCGFFDPYCQNPGSRNQIAPSYSCRDRTGQVGVVGVLISSAGLLAVGCIACYLSLPTHHKQDRFYLFMFADGISRILDLSYYLSNDFHQEDTLEITYFVFIIIPLGAVLPVLCIAACSGTTLFIKKHDSLEKLLISITFTLAIVAPLLAICWECYPLLALLAFVGHRYHGLGRQFKSYIDPSGVTYLCIQAMNTMFGVIPRFIVQVVVTYRSGPMDGLEIFLVIKNVYMILRLFYSAAYACCCGHKETDVAWVDNALEESKVPVPKFKDSEIEESADRISMEVLSDIYPGLQRGDSALKCISSKEIASPNSIGLEVMTNDPKTSTCLSKGHFLTLLWMSFLGMHSHITSYRYGNRSQETEIPHPYSLLPLLEEKNEAAFEVPNTKARDVTRTALIKMMAKRMRKFIEARYQDSENLDYATAALTIDFKFVIEKAINHVLSGAFTEWAFKATSSRGEEESRWTKSLKSE